MSTSTTASETIYKSQILEHNADEYIKVYGFKHSNNPWPENPATEGNEETYRTRLRRQRDKILYTGGFRRLQDKTQVMSATLKGDHRTRLTHTLEVEQIAVSIADALGLNKDLASAIALGHDVGHTPFGHAAERKLNELLKAIGGFHHPIQSVKYLWEKYGEKIDSKIYEGILAHDSDMYQIEKEDAKKQLENIYAPKSVDSTELWKKVSTFFNNVPTTLEAQVVIWADKIAYITHDLEDFKDSVIYTLLKKAEPPTGETTEKKLCSVLEALINAEEQETGKKVSLDDDLTKFESRDLIRAITSNLIKTSARILNEIQSLSQSDVYEKTKERLRDGETDKKKQYLNSLIINFDDSFRDNYYKLRKTLDDKYIFSPNVQRSDAKAENIISFLFKQFSTNYKLTPLIIREKIDKELRSILCEYLEINADTRKSDKLEDLESALKQCKTALTKYEDKRNCIISQIIASYISTMSDTYAENMYCNLSGSKDIYNL